MDFSPEELDVSPPCFLVENSQADESQQLCRSDSDQHLAILKRLPIFSVSARTDQSTCSTNERNPVVVRCPTGSGENGRHGEPGDVRGEQGNGGQGQGRDDGSGDADNGGGGDGAGNDGGAGGGEGGHGGGGDDGGGGGGDDDGDDGDDDNDEESPPPEEPSSSSSSDALPKLIRPEAVISGNQWKGQKFSASELQAQQAAERGTRSDSSLSGAVTGHGSGGSVHESSGDHYSQASTGIVGEGDDIAADMPSVVGSGSLSEASTAVVSPVETEKKSTSSSSIGRKSERGSSAASSSSYHGDLSSLSSAGSLQISPEVRKHLPLSSMLRTQSTSDTSSSSAGSKEEKIHSKVAGFKLFSLEEKDESEACSSQEDMFAPREVDKEQEHVHSDLSGDGSHILPPKHHSTPTEGHSTKGSHEHAHEKSLYQQVLTAKHRTSTPVEGGGILSTPPSQGTPIDTVSRFQSLQFSGEVSAKDASSSSSDKVSPSPSERSSIPVLIPSSPTAGEDKSGEGKTSSKEKSSSECSPGIEDNEEQSEMARAAAALVESFDLSQEEHLETPTSLQQKETSDDDEVMLPRWQQLQVIPQQGSVSDDKKSSSSNSNSSEGPSSDNAAKGQSQPPQIQEWQSVISAMGSTSSSSQGKKMDAAAPVSTSDKEQLVQVQAVDMSFLESTKTAPLISKADFPKETPQGDQSLSPSSLAIDPFHGNDGTRKDVEEGPAVAPGPTQPEMSEDMFRPSITQESAEQQDISNQPDNEPMEEENVAEDSQEIVFSLHLTQSQADMDSQAPFETILPMEEIQEEVTVTEAAGDQVRDDKSNETNKKEEMAPLTKQDSSSQSILAPLAKPLGIQPLPSVTDAQAAKDMELNQEQPDATVLSDVPESVTFSSVSSHHEEEKGDKGDDDVVRESDDSHPSTDNVAVVFPPDQLILAEDSEGVAPLKEKDTSEDLARQQLSTPEKDVPVRKPIKSRLPSAVFSETSSESGLSGGFHFSLPKEPLRPSMSTTPPPIKLVRHDTPDSQERGSRRSIMPDVVLPVVTETPGMSSQAPPISLDQIRPQSLTVSMPRHGSPLSDSENSEPVLRFDTTLPPVSTTPGSSSFIQPSAPEPSRSIFSRAREALAKGKKREVEADSEHDPFAFTAEDEDPEPVRKRPRRASPRAVQEKEVFPQREVSEFDETRAASTGGAEERPSVSGDKSIQRSKEQDVSTKRSSLQERESTKRGRHDESSESAESEGSEERGSKRARKEEDEPKSREKSEKGSSEAVHYRQITHTRIVTTVTTQVQRVVTVSIVDKESGEVVQVLTYEEDDRPKIESEEKEKEEVDEFVESSLDGSRVVLTSKSPKRQELQQQSRTSPRIKNGKIPSATKSVSKQVSRVPGKTQEAMEKPGKSGSDKVLGEAVGESTKGKGALPQSRDGDSLGEIPAITRQATVPVAEEEPPLQRTSSSDSPLALGTRVLAKWLDNYFYPGVVTTKQYKNGRYLITFDDGDRRRIPRENIIIKDVLPAGQSVMAQGDVEDDFYEQGVIVGHYREGDERGYEIQTQSGAISRFPRSRVILSEEQAAAILSSESSFNVTSGSSVSIGAHSLRLRKDGSAGSSGASLHSITKSGGTGAKDTSRDTSSKDTSGSSSDEKTRRKKAARPSPHASPRGSKVTASATTDVTPKSTHKSTHKVKAQARRAGQRIGESESSSDEQHGAPAGKRRQARRGLSASYGAKSPVKLPSDKPFEPPSRRSPRNQTSRKEGDGEEETAAGSITANRNIFAGLAFLVTGVVRDRNEPDESDSESERIEFNRDTIERQIEAGGGVVLSSFPQSQISGAECFLVSNKHQRTQKYFQSLASGIPCVSHMWINDSCAFGKRLDYKRYLLPAGESLEIEGEIVECRPRRNILGNMRVYLHGSQHFKDTWSSVLLAAGCKMVTKIPNRFDYQCDVVICEDNKLPASVKHAANLLGIPIVSLEWLLQSLINGRQVPFDGHPKYDYRYKSS